MIKYTHGVSILGNKTQTLFCFVFALNRNPPGNASGSSTPPGLLTRSAGRHTGGVGRGRGGRGRWVRHGSADERARWGSGGQRSGRGGRARASPQHDGGAAAAASSPNTSFTFDATLTARDAPNACKFHTVNAARSIATATVGPEGRLH